MRIERRSHHIREAITEANTSRSGEGAAEAAGVAEAAEAVEAAEAAEAV